jgi:phenylacetate-CoA ligase
VITPGINKAEIFNALRRLAPRYARTILVGYPPFVKDIIDEAPAQGIDVKALRLRLLFAAEAFSESFRDYLVEKTGMKSCLRDTMNIYGTADIGTMAYETPVSIMVRRAALANDRLFDTIFNGIRKTPTLAQFNPFFVNFEEVGGELLLTGDNTVPLIRYELGDHGGVRSFDAITKDAAECGVDMMSTAKESGIEDVTYRLPFVHVYERNDFSTSIYGLQIYPEMIREALLYEGVRDHYTGKFTLETQFDDEHNQCLAVHIEMQQDRSPNEELRMKTLELMLAELKKRSSEYRELHRHLGERANPRLHFWPAEHPEYFKPGGKQKWVKKNS